MDQDTQEEDRGPGGDREEAAVVVENIGGIDRCDVRLPPGVTVLTGRNATNRTSFLSALADVLGGSPATLKSDAEHGRIELRFGETAYRREYSRDEASFSSSGNQYTERRDLVDLFVRLLEDNPVRRTVERGEDLRDVIMRPVDTEEIKRGIRERAEERDRIDDRLGSIERERDRLSSLAEQRTELEGEIESVEEEITDVRETVEDYDAGETEAKRAEELIDELEELREELRGVASRLDRQDDRLDTLRAEEEAVRAELSDLEVPGAELEAVEDELKGLRRRKRELEGAIDDLRRIVSFNEDLISGDGLDLPGVEADDDVTGELDPMAQPVECWTCGTEVERGAIADRLDELRDVIEGRAEERREIDAEIESVAERAEDLRGRVNRRDELESELADIEEEIQAREAKREELARERDRIRGDIEAVEARVEETEELRESDLIEAYRRLSQLEYERGRLERELEDIDEDIERIEGLAAERERLTTRRAELEGEIEDLRSRVRDLERGAVEEFNEHMAAVLDVLGYANVARVWIERKATDGESEATFELHVVRETADGSVYEDTVATLSESEREVTGLVVVLAGYLVHEVYEEVPFMLLDSLEAIDSDRIAALVGYFAEHVPYLVVALLPEDATALPEEYARVTAAAIAPG